MLASVSGYPHAGMQKYLYRYILGTSPCGDAFVPPAVSEVESARAYFDKQNSLVTTGHYPCQLTHGALVDTVHCGIV